jgi:bifunctional non-homologous end joining protein LigD
VKKVLTTPDRVDLRHRPGRGREVGQVQEAALLMRALLDELGLKGWLKTSGGKGLHVVVPMAPKLDYDTVKDFSQAVVQHLAQHDPVALRGQEWREPTGWARIFVDYLAQRLRLRPPRQRSRPARGRARRLDAGVVGPAPRAEGRAQWTIATAREYLSFARDDPVGRLPEVSPNADEVDEGHGPRASAFRQIRLT